MFRGHSLLLALSAASAFAADVDDLSLDALLDTPVEVATKDARTTREAPGVVLVVTREELLASGARDLLEALQLVPGFTFHQDVQGGVGVAFRGLWGHEGKVLLMLDGIELNEPLYGTTQFGHHVLLSQVERIEVIRGPGSAIYGGSAELAVINVITRSGGKLNGAAFGGRYAQGRTDFHDWSVGGSIGAKHESTGIEWSLHATGGLGRRTQREWTDFSGNSISLRNEQLDPLSINAGLSWKGLKARFLFDNYVQGSSVGFGTAAPGSFVIFRTIAGDVQYEAKVSDTVTLRPRVTARAYTPWQTRDEASDQFYDKTAMRVLGGLTIGWAPIQSLDVTGGVEGYVDHGWLDSLVLTGAQTDFQGANTVTYGNVAGFVQGLWRTPYVNVAAGGRLEWHSAIGVNVAPRVALTRQFDIVNVKLLYGGAFRSPSIENLNLNPAVRAERTHVAEAEVGVQLGDVAYVAANGFYTVVQSPIVYGYDAATQSEGYVNGGAISTAGAEALIKLRGARGHLDVSYSLAVPVVADDVATYVVPGGGPTRFLGMPLHKFTLSGKLVMTDHLSLGGSAMYLGDRYAFLRGSPALDGTGTVGWVSDGLLVTAWVGVDDLGVDGLSAQLGVGNLLDANIAFTQPYDGGIAPIPGRGREFFVRLGYAFEAFK
ncbi:MAG: TonB-dependent receptor plug domain-containing protein [Archangium sp.]